MIGKILEKKKKPAAAVGRKNQPGLKCYLLVTISNEKNEDELTTILTANGLTILAEMIGEGAAKFQILDILGLVGNKYSVIFSVIEKDQYPKIVPSLNSFFEEEGAGLSFTIDISGYTGLRSMTNIFKYANFNKKKEKANGK